MQTTIDGNRRHITLIVCSLIGVALAGAMGIYLMMGESAPSRPGFFYDTDELRLVTAEVFEHRLPDSPLVRAHVYSCTACGDENSRFVGYLEAEHDGVPVVRRVEDRDWTPLHSPAGLAITNAAEAVCGADFETCTPTP